MFSAGSITKVMREGSANGQREYKMKLYMKD